VSGPLNAGQPIKEPEDDLLGVAPFAHALAESIPKMTPAKGFVMALPGESGSGKSSILNLIERRINYREMAAFTVGIGLNETLGYGTPADIVYKFPQFYWTNVAPQINLAIRYLKCDLQRSPMDCQPPQQCFLG
jgi:ABC-type taurine transport system ATPase subunit